MAITTNTNAIDLQIGIKTTDNRYIVEINSDNINYWKNNTVIVGGGGVTVRKYKTSVHGRLERMGTNWITINRVYGRPNQVISEVQRGFPNRVEQHSTPLCTSPFKMKMTGFSFLSHELEKTSTPTKITMRVLKNKMVSTGSSASAWTSTNLEVVVNEQIEIPDARMYDTIIDVTSDVVVDSGDTIYFGLLMDEGSSSFSASGTSIEFFFEEIL